MSLSEPDIPTATIVPYPGLRRQRLTLWSLPWVSPALAGLILRLPLEICSSGVLSKVYTILAKHRDLPSMICYPMSGCLRRVPTLNIAKPNKEMVIATYYLELSQVLFLSQLILAFGMEDPLAHPNPIFLVFIN